MTRHSQNSVLVLLDGGGWARAPLSSMGTPRTHVLAAPDRVVGSFSSVSEALRHRAGFPRPGEVTNVYAIPAPRQDGETVLDLRDGATPPAEFRRGRYLLISSPSSGPAAFDVVVGVDLVGRLTMLNTEGRRYPSACFDVALWNWLRAFPEEEQATTRRELATAAEIALGFRGK